MKVRIVAIFAVAIAAACSDSSTAPGDIHRSNNNTSNTTSSGTVVVTVDGGQPAVPLQFVTVQIYSVDSGGQYTFLRQDSTGQTGKATFTKLQAGTYAFYVLPMPNVYEADTVRNVKVTGGKTVDVNVVLPLAPVPSGPGSLTGVVAGDSASADSTGLVYLSGAVVTAYAEDSTGQHRTLAGVDTTKSGGGYTFSSLQPGKYELYAVPSGTTWAAESVSVYVIPAASTYEQILLPLRSK